MLEKLKKYSLYQNVFCGVEHIGTTTEQQLHFLVLKKQKQTFEIEKSASVKSISDLEKEIPKQQHVFLIINNEQVLTKKLDGVFEFEKAITKTFSNLQRSDFYTEVLHTENSTFVSICRKDIVTIILKKYEEQQLNVIGFSLGNLMTSQLNLFINDDAITTSNAQAVFENKQLQDIIFQEDVKHENYNINGLEIGSQHLLPLSGIISYYTQNRQTQSNFTDVVSNLNANFKQKRIFSLGLKTGLSFIFVLLLLSFLVFSNYNTKVNHLSNENQVSKSLKGNLLKLKAKTQKKRKLFQEVTSSANSRVSFYMNVLGNSLPKTVLLSKLQYQPKTKGIKKNKEILVHSNTITLKGKSSNSDAFSEWLEILEKTDWIKDVSISNYGTGKKKTTKFEIKLEIKE